MTTNRNMAPNIRTLSSYGGVPDARHIPGVSMAGGSTALVATAPAFTVDDVGKRIAVASAGGTNDMLFSTVDTYVSSTEVRLANPAAGVVGDFPNQSATIGTDCAPAIQAAIDDANADRTLFIDGAYALFSPVSGDATSIGFIGDGGNSRCHVACRPTDVALSFFNSEVSFQDMAFVGTNGASQDAGQVIKLATCNVSFKKCGFYGLMSLVGSSGIIVADLTDWSMTDCLFGGCSGSSGTASSAISMTRVRRTEFINTDWQDYSHIAGQLFSKTGMGSPFCWVEIKSMGEAEQNGSIQMLNQGLIYFRNCRMDEGAYHQIKIGSGTNIIDRVHIEGLECNAWGGSIGCVVLENVRHTLIARSSMGLQAGNPATPLTAISLKASYHALVDSVAVGRGTTVTKFVARDSQSVIVKNSPGFTAWDVQRVDDFRVIENDVGGVVPFTKDGPITDADFAYPPREGTVGVNPITGVFSIRKRDGTWRTV